MSSASTYLAAAAAVGAASEATGTTAFTPLGRQAREGFDAPGGGGGPSTDAILAALGNAGEAGTSLELDLSGLAEGAPGAGGGAAEALAAALEAQSGRADEWRAEAEEWRQRAEERAEDPTGGTGLGGPFAEFVGGLEGALGDLEGDVGDLEAQLEEYRQEAEDRANDARDGLFPNLGVPSVDVPDVDAGEAVSDSVGFFSEVGNTGAQSVRALYGREYSPEDTLAEGVLGPERRRIDWSKYQLTDAPDLEEQIANLELPDRPRRSRSSSSSSTSSSDGPNLAEMAYNNVVHGDPEGPKDTAGESSSSSTRGTSTVSTDLEGSDRKLARAAEEIEEENRRRRNAPAVGRVL